MAVFYRIFGIGFVSLMFVQTVLAQRLKYDEPKVDREKKRIFLPYEIKESAKFHHLFDINLYYSEDKGKTFIGPLQKLEGDFGEDITPGKKLIIWNYYEEAPNFTGKDIMFKFKMTYKADPNYLGGPENALLSALLPGWGDTKVFPKHKLWYLNTVASFSFIGAGLIYADKSNQTLEAYRQSNSIQEADDLFNESNRQKSISGTLIVAGAAVWLTDIARVAIRGLKNKKRQKSQLRRKIQKEEHHQKHHHKPELGLHYDMVDTQPTFGLKLKF